MKKETIENKLNELLGLTEVVEEIKKVKRVSQGNIREISEDEIQEFRELQGITYFLQAPALFQSKVCKHCGAAFLVSRLYVAYCSWTCINKSIEDLMGCEWSRKDQDYEVIVAQVYEGNEPLWIRNLPKLKLALQKVTYSLESLIDSVPSTDENGTPSLLVRL